MTSFLLIMGLISFTGIVVTVVGYRILGEDNSRPSDQALRDAQRRIESAQIRAEIQSDAQALRHELDDELRRHRE